MCQKIMNQNLSPNVKDSRNQNGDIFPYCAMVFAPGKGTPGWVNWPTLTKRCHPISSALRPAILFRKASLGLHQKKLLHLITVLNPQSAASRDKILFLMEELVMHVLN